MTATVPRLTDEQRKKLPERVREVNKRSASRPR